MERAADGQAAPAIWRGWREIEKQTKVSANTLRKMAAEQGLPIFKLAGEACLTPTGWSDFVLRLAGEKDRG